jgi:predicted nucleic-acid-binding protein
VKIAADTNVLARAIVRDDAKQARAAEKALGEAELVAIAIPTLCELVWVLSHGYGVAASDIAQTIRKLLEAGNVVVDRPSAEAGLVMLEAGGDFADGAIAYEGRRLGAEAFVTFDKKAARKLLANGEPTVLLDA